MKRLLFLLPMLLPQAVSAAVDVQEGEWEISLVMRVEGQDYGPYTRKQCITAADARDPSRLFAEGGSGCEYTNKRYFTNQFSFNVRCNAGIPLTGTGQVEYSAERMSGSMTVEARMPGGPSVETQSQIQGRWLGRCE